MKKYFFIILFFTVICSGELFGQSSRTPDFKFLKTFDYNKINDSVRKNEIENILQKYTIKPTFDQQKKILNELILDDSAFSGSYEFYAVIASHFYKAFDIGLRKKYNKIVKNTVDTNFVKDYIIPENRDSFFFGNFELTDSLYPEHAFRCLDFNNDGIVDMILLPQGYFGPSLGLVFYGKQEKDFTYLYDCAGDIESIEKKNDKLYIRYIVPIIDPQEPYVFVTIAFDYKQKNCNLDSKLYYAQQTVIPELIQKPILFETNDSVYLRWSPQINSKMHIKDQYDLNTDDSLTSTLFGNVVAQFPRSAEGYVLAYDNNWAFVAFNSKVLYTQSTLHHGMDNTVGDIMNGWSTYITPEQYWCGWIEKKYLNFKSGKGVNSGEMDTAHYFYLIIQTVICILKFPQTFGK